MVKADFLTDFLTVFLRGLGQRNKGKEGEEKGEGGREEAKESYIFIRPLIPLSRAPPSWTNHLSKAPYTTLQGLQCQHMNFRNS